MNTWYGNNDTGDGCTVYIITFLELPQRNLRQAVCHDNYFMWKQGWSNEQQYRITTVLFTLLSFI